MKQHTIVAEPLDPASFARFGRVLSVDALEELPIDWYRGANSVRGPIELEADVPVEYLLLRSAVRPLSMRYLERHRQLTQTFIPLDGSPFVFLAAAPDAATENGFPVLDEIRAFLSPGRAGINIHRGTWHEPAFPLVEGQLTLVTSHRDLTIGLQTAPDVNGEVLGFDLDKRSVSRLGASVSIRLS
jgi:ureidoglycolate lyase